MMHGLALVLNVNNKRLRRGLGAVCRGLGVFGAQWRSLASVGDEVVVEVVADVFTDAAVAVSVDGGARLSRPTMSFERTMWEARVVVNCLNFTLCYLL